MDSCAHDLLKKSFQKKPVSERGKQERPRKTLDRDVISGEVWSQPQPDPTGRGGELGKVNCTVEFVLPEKKRLKADWGGANSLLGICGETTPVNHG